jgi:GH25 family lysozyme M1 (1,4-beta-N-acetylmuramidase)
MGLFGQDWSGYQSATPSTADIDYVFLKVTEGLSYESPKWKSQYATATKAKLVVGFYHYPHMANSPKSEADYFLSKVTPKKGEIVVLDWEGYDTNNKNVSKAVQRAYKDAYLKYMKGKLPNNPVGMYCSPDYWTNVDTNSYCGDFLWIATAGKAAGSPGIDYKWTFHQYSTAGGVDHNYSLFTSRAALAAWTLSFVQNTSEEDVAVTQADANLIAKTVLTMDGLIGAPSDAGDIKTNEFWQLRSYVADTGIKVRAIQAQVTALQAAVAAVSAPVIDIEALATAVVKKLGAELAN